MNEENLIRCRVLNFYEPDEDGNLFYPNSINLKGIDDLVESGHIVDYELDEDGITFVSKNSKN
jgi:hypothetical protein